MTTDDLTAQRTGRGTAAWGFTFVVLLLASAGMASVPGGDEPAWLRWLAWVVAALALAKAVLLAGGSGALGLVAPLAFIALVLALSLAALVRPRRA